MPLVFALAIEVLVVVLVGVQGGDVNTGFGQCTAEMVAVQESNQAQGRPVPRVFGAVTLGNIWRFLQLEGDLVKLDTREYYICELGRAIGVLVWVVRSLRPA